MGGGLSPWVTRSEPPKDKIKRPEGHSTRSWVPEDLQTSSESIFLKRKHLSKFICEKLKKRRCVKHISESLDSQVYLPPTHAVSICRTQTNKNILLFARSLNADLYIVSSLKKLLLSESCKRLGVLPFTPSALRPNKVVFLFPFCHLCY